MKLQQMSDGRVDIYKWVKVGQCASLMLMGILFIIISLLDTAGDAASLILSISLGIIGSLYGVLEVLAGYLLYHTPFSKDAVVGEIVISFAIVLFIQHNVINELLSYFFIIFFILFAIMLVLFGVDLLVGKHIDHSVVKAVFSFIFAAIFAGGSIVFLIFYIQDPTSIQKVLLLIVGSVLIVFSIVSLVVMLKRTHETQKAINEEKILNEPIVKEMPKKEEKKQKEEPKQKEEVVATEEYYEGTYTQKPESEGTLTSGSHTDIVKK